MLGGWIVISTEDQGRFIWFLPCNKTLSTQGGIDQLNLDRVLTISLQHIHLYHLLCCNVYQLDRVINRHFLGVEKTLIDVKRLQAVNLAQQVGILRNTGAKITLTSQEMTNWIYANCKDSLSGFCISFADLHRKSVIILKNAVLVFPTPFRFANFQ